MHHDATSLTGIVEVDVTRPGNPIVHASPGFEQLTGYAASEVLGRTCRLLQGPDTDPRTVGVLADAVAAGEEAHVTILNYRADGTPFWNELTLTPRHDEQGALVRYLGIQRDVTERLDASARAHRLAHYDAATGLPNPATLHHELRGALQRARVREREIALLAIDLDDFRTVNDRHGHRAGDVLLRMVADRLRDAIRPSDMLARRHGDEFLLLAPDLGDAHGIGAELATRLRAALREPFSLDGTPVVVRASIGVSTLPRDARTADELLAHAELAMYAAKGAGKDGVHVHARRDEDAPADHHPAGVDPFAHAAELLRILADDDIRAVYQPLVDLRDGSVVGYEALARGPEGSPLHHPDALFATAAEAGLTAELDWACRAAAVRGALEASLGRSATLFVNTEPSAIDARCPRRHAELWSRALRELDLVVEITERAVTDRPAELVAIADAHREEGRGVALDDVGADVRSLALLPLVQPDVIKLDLRLVQQRASTEQASIVAAVAAERERTGATVLAEGIETEAQVAVARTLGATLGQGWWFGRPGPLPTAGLGAPADGARLPLRRRVLPVAPHGRTPFQVVAAERDLGEATKRLLLPMSMHLEQRALQIGEGAVILTAFQDAAHFTPRTARRYEVLAQCSSLVAALGVGLPAEPAPGVRGATLLGDDELAGEWSVVVLGPHFAGALVAVDLGDDGPDRDRRFRVATTYDRTLVIAAARTLLDRVSPRERSATAQRSS